MEERDRRERGKEKATLYSFFVNERVSTRGKYLEFTALVGALISERS